MYATWGAAPDVGVPTLPDESSWEQSLEAEAGVSTATAVAVRAINLFVPSKSLETKDQMWYEI